MARNLFIVNTPLQLLNAIEARDRFHSGEDNWLAIVRTPLRSGVAAEQFHQMLDGLIDDEWQEVWYPEITKIRQLAFAVVSAAYIRRVGKVGALYTGAFLSAQCHLINSIQHRSLVLFDDGRGVHYLLQKYCDQPGVQRWRHRLSFRKGAWPTEKQLHVFSSFDVDWPESLLTANDYRSLRKRISRTATIRRDEIVIITQPVERFLGVAIDYERMIDNLHSVLDFKSVRLINHPNDPDPPALGEALTCPIELFGLQEGYLPQAFVSFLSSATRTLRLIYDRPVLSLEILQSTITEPIEYELADTYEEFRQSGVIIVPNAQWAGNHQTDKHLRAA